MEEGDEGVLQDPLRELATTLGKMHRVEYKFTGALIIKTWRLLIFLPVI